MDPIKIMEVGPRDGWQNVKTFIPTDTKLELIDGLVQAGVKSLEITSFVSPKAIPQLADAKEIASACVQKYPDLELWALVPNLRGAQSAHEAGIKNITYVISMSKTHNQANIRRTHEESFSEMIRVMETYPEMNLAAGIATIFGCPFEGLPQVKDAVAFAKRLWDTGARTLMLADTIGVAVPGQVRDTIHAVQDALPDAKLQIHIHDTRNMGIANTLAAIECGVTNVQSTLGGLGGCPFAPGASGNTATEDLVYMLNRMGYDTGVDFDKLLALSKAQRLLIPDGIYSGHHMNIGDRGSCS